MAQDGGGGGGGLMTLLYQKLRVRVMVGVKHFPEILVVLSPITDYGRPGMTRCIMCERGNRFSA